MTQQYAKDQPSGFPNRIERVAIVGAGGQIGSYLVQGLLSTGKHTVTAISRKTSKSDLPEGVEIARVDYDDELSLIDALRGQQVLLICMSFFAPPGSQDKIIAAAAKAGVPYIMPNAWSCDISDKKLIEEACLGNVLEGIKAVEDAGVSSWITLCPSFWYEYSLALGPGWYGFDIPNKKVTFFGDGKVRVNSSTWDQCGRAIAKFFSLKELPDDENDTTPTVSQWKNKPLYISSFLVSQRDMLDSLNRVQGTTDADWTIEYEDCEDRYARGKKMLEAGDISGFSISLYTRVFYPNGGGNFEEKQTLANDILQLPQEDLDESTRKAITMTENEWNPFARVQ